MGHFRALPWQPDRRGRDQEQRVGLFPRPQGRLRAQRNLHLRGVRHCRTRWRPFRPGAGHPARPLGGARYFPRGRSRHPVRLVGVQLRHRPVADVHFLRHFRRHWPHHHLVVLDDGDPGAVVPPNSRAYARPGRQRQPHRSGHIRAFGRLPQRRPGLALGISHFRIDIRRHDRAAQRPAPAPASAIAGTTAAGVPGAIGGHQLQIRTRRHAVVGAKGRRP